MWKIWFIFFGTLLELYFINSQEILIPIQAAFGFTGLNKGFGNTEGAFEAEEMRVCRCHPGYTGFIGDHVSEAFTKCRADLKRINLETTTHECIRICLYMFYGFFYDEDFEWLPNRTAITTLLNSIYKGPGGKESVKIYRDTLINCAKDSKAGFTIDNAGCNSNELFHTCFNEKFCSKTGKVQNKTAKP